MKETLERLNHVLYVDLDQRTVTGTVIDVQLNTSNGRELMKVLQKVLSLGLAIEKVTDQWDGYRLTLLWTHLPH